MTKNYLLSIRAFEAGRAEKALGRKRKPFEWSVDNNNCWVCTSHTPNGSGYPTASFRGKHPTVAFIFYTLCVGEIKPNKRVLHSCDNPRCCNPDHLFLGTQKDNIQDMLKKGRESRGESRHNSKLTKAQVLAIYMDKRATVDIMNEYKISQAQVSRIKTRHRWRWLTSEVCI